jgi:hypothetical protein
MFCLSRRGIAPRCARPAHATFVKGGPRNTAMLCHSIFAVTQKRRNDVGNVSQCAGETGKEWSVQVRHNEGAAIRIDPEPSAAVGKGDSEASIGACVG